MEIIALGNCLLPDGRKGGCSELGFGRPLVCGSVTYVTIVTINWLHEISYSGVLLWNDDNS